MPCSPEHLKKLDARLDAILGKDCEIPPKKDDDETESEQDNNEGREELRTGGLSKRNPV
jgi:hypothetical protein